MLLKNKIAIITGASRGIGRAVAISFVKEGAQVILVARNLDQLQEVKSEIENIYRDANVLLYQADIRSFEDLKKIFNDLASKKIYIDILVNNAGIWTNATLQMTKPEVIKDIYETNVYGSIYASQLAIKSMLKRGGGSIINLSSIVGVNGSAGQTVYASSKSAIIGFTKSLSKELAPLKIRVNAVSPGFIDTDMIKGIDQCHREKIINNIGMRRIGKPEDIAKVIFFLASDYSEYVTGQIIGVDGGLII